jgi:hypothetical protein
MDPSAWDFLRFMAHEPGHARHRAERAREAVESLTGQAVGSYGEAAAALLAPLGGERS